MDKVYPSPEAALADLEDGASIAVSGFGTSYGFACSLLVAARDKGVRNLTLVSNLLKEYSANAIRVMLLNHHYRYPWECFVDDLQVATETVALFQKLHTIVGNQPNDGDSILRDRFIADLNLQ